MANMKFAVCVHFKIRPEAWEDFMPLMMKNASTSLANEEGCLQFDVCSNEDRPFEVFLYEIYASKDAFSEHVASEHFRKFDRDVSEMIEDKQVQTYRTVA